jgi:hypothetical protein
MKCIRCGGRVLIDRVFTSETYLELFCFLCGKRWELSHPQNKGGFALWLWKIEKKYLTQSSTKS